eukprot:125580-Pleurochrysis_carterae.AAC.1
MVYLRAGAPSAHCAHVSRCARPASIARLALWVAPQWSVRAEAWPKRHPRRVAAVRRIIDHPRACAQVRRVYQPGRHVR